MSAVETTNPNMPKPQHNKKKPLTFEDWPEEVINLPCKKFHAYIKNNGLSPEQQSDLRRVRRRAQSKRAATNYRRLVASRKMMVKPFKAKADGRTDIADNICNLTGNDIALKQYIIARLQEEVNRMQTDQDAANTMLQLSGTAIHPNDASDQRYEDFL